MPERHSIAPTFLVADVGATASWYRENLGLAADFFPKSEPYVYASMHRDGIEIMLLGLAGYGRAPGPLATGRVVGCLHPHARTSRVL